MPWNKTVDKRHRRLFGTIVGEILNLKEQDTGVFEPGAGLRTPVFFIFSVKKVGGR